MTKETKDWILNTHKNASNDYDCHEYTEHFCDESSMIFVYVSNPDIKSDVDLWACAAYPDHNGKVRFQEQTIKIPSVRGCIGEFQPNVPPSHVLATYFHEIGHLYEYYNCGIERDEPSVKSEIFSWNYAIQMWDEKNVDLEFPYDFMNTCLQSYHEKEELDWDLLRNDEDQNFWNKFTFGLF